LAVFFWLPNWVQQRGLSEVAAADDSERFEINEDSPLEQEPAVISEPSEETPTPEAAVSEAAELAVADLEVEDQPVEKIPPSVDPTAKAFAKVMSSGLAAFETGDFETAQQAFEGAVSLSPESTEAAEGLARSQQALRLIEIAQHRERAMAFEQGERWREAEAEYKAALALDSSLRFAREGEVRASSRAQLNEDMSYHIGHPDRLVEDRVLAEAREVLAEAEAADSMTPGLQKQIEKLRQIVEIASTPVQVILVSDSSTEVTVYRVGRLGRFDRRELDLRPGIYTVVGTRNGYRDVRRQLKVEVGGQGQPLSVRCEEKI
jgi:tetratricopeptide (TPR) repeat protein